MTRKDSFEVQIPFAGFYGGMHDESLDHAFNLIMSDRASGCELAPDKLFSLAFGAVSWGDVYRAYARDYAASFMHEHELTGHFVAMESPKYYNFETDRVFVSIDRPSLAKIIRKTDPALLSRVATDRHTSRSGFVSFYTPDWKAWGPVSSWDHNQLETLLLAYLETDRGAPWDIWAELDLMESAQCNGHLDDWICDNAGPGFKRAYAIWDYLQARQERAAA
jgi:hypothetical protein